MYLFLEDLRINQIWFKPTYSKLVMANLFGCFELEVLLCNNHIVQLVFHSWFLVISQMSLQESLNRFKQQQEKCQSTLSSIAARAAPSKAAQPYKATPSSAPPKVIASVKFSNDTERLQHINAIRKSPVGAQLKRVIDLLFEVWYFISMKVVIYKCCLLKFMIVPTFFLVVSKHLILYDFYVLLVFQGTLIENYQAWSSLKNSHVTNLVVKKSWHIRSIIWSTADTHKASITERS